MNQSNFFLSSILLIYILLLASHSNLFAQGWNTFTGASLGQYAYDIETDDSGYIYMCGFTDGTFGSPARAYDALEDGFVSKYNANGALVWVTFLGGDGNDRAYSLSLDDTGNVYVAGRSNQSWGTPNRSYTGSTDIWSTKLNNTGNVVWNTFLGGSGIDNIGNDISVSDSGYVYVIGSSYTTWGSPIRAHSTSDNDAVIVKLTNSGNIVWQTFLGGNERQTGHSIQVDSLGSVFLYGQTRSTWGSSPLQTYEGDWDVWTAKLNASGDLQWHLFLGQQDQDDAGGLGNSMAMDDSSNLYITGYSNATWGSPLSSFQGSFDGWVVKIDSSGSIKWSTFVGGSSSTDQANDISLGKSGNIYIAGTSQQTWGSPLSSFSGNHDGWVVKLKPDGTFLWNTFLGGSGQDFIQSITVDTNEVVYTCGYSQSSWGSPVTAYGGGDDAIVVRMDSAGALPVSWLYVDSKTDYDQGRINLLWATSSELNNSHFNVEKFDSKIGWISIGRINGSGTTFTKMEYTFFDEHPIEGVNYYRIRQVDYDGLESISKVEVAKYEPSVKLFCYPNPASDKVNVHLSKDMLIGQVSIFNSFGIKVLTTEVHHQNLIVDTSQFAAGVYQIVLSAKDTGTVEVIQFVVL